MKGRGSEYHCSGCYRQRNTDTCANKAEIRDQCCRDGKQYSQDERPVNPVPRNSDCQAKQSHPKWRGRRGALGVFRHTPHTVLGEIPGYREMDVRIVERVSEVPLGLREALFPKDQVAYSGKRYENGCADEGKLSRLPFYANCHRVDSTAAVPRLFVTAHDVGLPVQISSMTNRKRYDPKWLLALTGIFIFAIALFFPALFGKPVWDDTNILAGTAFGANNLQSAFTHTFLGTYFRPLTSASLVVNSMMTGGNPLPYHLTNILLHAATAVLVSFLAFLVTERKLAGVLAGIFFAAQPMQVGATAWIGGRTDTLSSFFLVGFMAGMILYYKHAERKWLGLSVVCFLLAALSKEQAVFAVVAVPVSVLVLGSRRKWKDVYRICAPFAVVILLYILYWTTEGPKPLTPSSTFLQSVSLFLRTAAFYGLAFIAPNNRSLMSFTLENYGGVAWILTGVLITAGVIYGIVRCNKTSKPLTWIVLCGLLVYWPVSNFPPIPAFVVAPYRCTLSGTVVACLFGVAGASAWGNRRYALVGLLGINLIAGVIVSWWGTQQWLTPQRFFGRVTAIDPHFIVGVGNCALNMETAGKPEVELQLTDRTLTWVFDDPNWQRLLATKKTAAFSQVFYDRMKANCGAPDFRALDWMIGCNASALLHLNRLAEAIEVQRDALIVGPTDARLHYGYGEMLLKTDHAEAIRQLEEALRLSPKFPECAAALAGEKAKTGNMRR